MRERDDWKLMTVLLNMLEVGSASMLCPDCPSFLDELFGVLLTSRAFLAGSTVLSHPVSRRQTEAINQTSQAQGQVNCPTTKQLARKASPCLYSSCVFLVILNISGYCHSYPN